MDNFVRLSKHAKERALERWAISEGTLLELAEKSVLYGVGINDCRNKRAKTWMKKKVRKKKNSCFIYGSYLFVFDELQHYLILITCLHVPYSIRAKINEKHRF